MVDSSLEVQGSEGAPRPLVVNCRTARGSKRMLRSTFSCKSIHNTQITRQSVDEFVLYPRVDRGIRWLPRAVLQLNRLAWS